MKRLNRHRFDGHILGVGTQAGYRIVVGSWRRSWLGTFSDLMVAHPDGMRELIAPHEIIADYVSSTYTFDRVTIMPVDVVKDAHSWQVTAGELSLEVTFGRRMLLGYPLLCIRGPVIHPITARLINPAARLVMPGVKTHGSAGHGKHEYYLAQDLHRVTSLTGAWGQQSLGALADVSPAPTFGFSSTPTTPALTAVTTFIDIPTTQ